MEEMRTFECAICGKNHTTIQDRINCETACLKEQEKLEKASMEAEKKKEEERINQAIDKLINDYSRICKDVNQFYKKYGKQTIYLDNSDKFFKDLINFIF